MESASRTKMITRPEQVADLRDGDFSVFIFRRTGEVSRNGWTKQVPFFSFTIMRASPDGKSHSFFRRRDIADLGKLLPKIEQRITELVAALIEGDASEQVG